MLEKITHVGKESAKATTGGGVILVLLPSCAIVFGQDMFSVHPMIGLPTLAILGIMILFGSLSLISTIFQRLQLTDKKEALALPPGSIRAAIALSLIVLFGLISIMLYQSGADRYPIAHLTSEQKNAMLNEPANRIIAVIAENCGKPACSPQTYTVHLSPPPSKESADLAKQLLILIGTLMTAVTSFYFGSQTAIAGTTGAPAGPWQGPRLGAGPAGPGPAGVGPAGVGPAGVGSGLNQWPGPRLGEGPAGSGPAGAGPSQWPGPRLAEGPATPGPMAPVGAVAPAPSISE